MDWLYLIIALMFALVVAVVITAISVSNDDK
jgi:hypothetical protein